MSRICLLLCCPRVKTLDCNSKSPIAVPRYLTILLPKPFLKLPHVTWPIQGWAPYKPVGRSGVWAPVVSSTKTHSHTVSGYSLAIIFASQVYRICPKHWWWGWGLWMKILHDGSSCMYRNPHVYTPLPASIDVLASQGGKVDGEENTAWKFVYVPKPLTIHTGYSPYSRHKIS